jgi:hypothetical protein
MGIKVEYEAGVSELLIDCNHIDGVVVDDELSKPTSPG